MSLSFFHWWSYKSYGSHGSSWVAVHVIPVSLPESMQYISLEGEGDAASAIWTNDHVIYKPWMNKK